MGMESMGPKGARQPIWRRHASFAHGQVDAQHGSASTCPWHPFLSSAGSWGMLAFLPCPACGPSTSPRVGRPTLRDDDGPQAFGWRESNKAQTLKKVLRRLQTKINTMLLQIRFSKLLMFFLQKTCCWEVSILLDKSAFSYGMTKAWAWCSGAQRNSASSFRRSKPFIGLERMLLKEHWLQLPDSSCHHNVKCDDTAL